jgi:nitrite reductase/ring-hydroxylating ferredoxin subunit
MLVLFVIAAFYRRQQHAQPLLLLVLELAGVSLMLVAGWMGGGTLVHRNQIGVDQRYANAGKWNEAYFNDASNDIAVAAMDELKVNAMKLLHINGKRIVLARTENGFAAFDDRCTHKGGSLAGGSMMCGTVQCPWHGSQFSVQNGNVTAGPAKTPIKTYPVSEKNGHVYVAINAS